MESFLASNKVASVNCSKSAIADEDKLKKATESFPPERYVAAWGEKPKESSTGYPWTSYSLGRCESNSSGSLPSEKWIEIDWSR
jgi:hypothetical protein